MRRSTSARHESPVDVRLQVIAVALEPALALARISAVPLDDLQSLVATGYFRELRSRGLTLPAIANRLQKSLRTVATLSQRASSGSADPHASERIRWRRKLVAHLGAHTPSSVTALRKLVSDATKQEFAQELEQLAQEGIVTLRGDAVELNAAVVSMVSDELGKRIDSVRHFLDAVTQVLYRRFWTPPTSAEAFARVLSFRIDRAQLGRLREEFYEALRKRVIESDGSAEPGAAEASVAICFVETPEALPWSPRR